MDCKAADRHGGQAAVADTLPRKPCRTELLRTNAALFIISSMCRRLQRVGRVPAPAGEHHLQRIVFRSITLRSPSIMSSSCHQSRLQLTSGGLLRQNPKNASWQTPSRRFLSLLGSTLHFTAGREPPPSGQVSFSGCWDIARFMVVS